MKTTWTLRHRTTGSTMVVTCDGSELTVALGERSEKKTLLSAEKAMKAAEHLVVERSARGFSLLKKEVAERDVAVVDKDPPPTTPAEALAFRLRKRKAEPRLGWRTWAVGEDRFTDAALPFVDDALSLALAAVERDDVVRPAADTFQVVQDVPSRRAALVLQSLGKSPRPGLRTLLLDTPWQTVTRQADVEWGSVTEAFAALVELEVAWVTGRAALGPLRHPRLRELVLQGNPLSPAALLGVSSTSTELPALERLGLCLASDAAVLPETLAALVQLATRDHLPALVTLDLEGVGDVTACLRALLKTPLSARLRSLAIAHSPIDDEDAFLAVLTEGAATLRRLEHIALPLDEISSTAVAQALALVPHLKDASEATLLSPPGAVTTQPA
jgi:hypothetical protein